jgi:SNF2 family DNA or RNA helicase
MLRRRKSDPGVAPELPPKIETNHLVALTREQVGLYKAVVRETVAAIRGSDGIQRRGLVLKLITLLKQICNHPAQYLHEVGPTAHRHRARVTPRRLCRRERLRPLSGRGRARGHDPRLRGGPSRRAARPG